MNIFKGLPKAMMSPEHSAKIKKALYKEKPVAYKMNVNSGDDLAYKCELQDGTQVMFVIPSEDKGNTEFNPTEPAQLLIRWISGVISPATA